MADEELAWERDLRELKQLMRNDVTSHERIRSRVLLLRERFYDGEIQTSASSWEQWAVGYFAYSASYLKRLLNPHPLSSGNWERQQQKDQAKIIHEQDKLEKARRKLEHEEELKRIKEATVRAKEPIKPKPKLKALSKPTVNYGQPVEAALPHLAGFQRTRIADGERYVALKELAQQGLLGKNPKGKNWAFTPWCEAFREHVGRERRDILRCIKEYEAAKDGTLCPNSQQSSVVPIKRSGAS